ncbi:MAG TPA: hypothetical protein VL175_06260 [Pirellulales bacterium]|nr:hypothetical protein [Pirellulales bacterium]
MSQRLGRLLVTLSVDAPFDPDAKTTSAVSFVRDELRSRRLMATWAVNKPAHWPWSDDFQTLGNEVALAADPSWLKKLRADLSREMTGIIKRAQVAGLTITSMVAPLDFARIPADLIVRHGIRTVRDAVIPLKAKATSQPRAAQLGLWLFPLSLIAPRTGRWWSAGPLRRLRGILDSRSGEGGAVQLVIDLQRVAKQGRAGQRNVIRVLDELESRRTRGEVEVVTLRAATERLAARYQGQPSRSILRAA